MISCLARRRRLTREIKLNSFFRKTTHSPSFMLLESSYTTRVRFTNLNKIVSIGVNPKSGKIEQLPYEVMKKDRKPELYFKHKDIINQIQIDKPSFSLYLHENMLDFFTDINDIADCLDIYSNSDSCESRVTYSYDVSFTLLTRG